MMRTAVGRWLIGLLAVVVALMEFGGFSASAFAGEVVPPAEAGTAVVWGKNTGTSAGVSTLPAALAGRQVNAIAASTGYSLVQTTEGDIVGWGSTGFATDAAWQNVPADLHNVKALAAGAAAAFALKPDGTVVAWGNNEGGLLDVPDGLSDVTAISAGSRVALALKSDGTVVGWGNPSDPANSGSSVPAGLADVVQVAAGWDHGLALKSDGTVVAWGNNSNGQTDVPTEIQGHATAVIAGNVGSFAVTDQGKLVIWGVSTPPPVGLADEVITKFSTDGGAFLALTASGKLYSWGAAAMATVPASLAGKTITAMAASTNHDLVIASDVAPVFAVTKVPVVSGNLWPAQKVTATAAEFSGTPDSVTTQWYIDGVAVTSFGDQLTFTVPYGAIGKTLTVKQTATKDGHEVVAESAPTAAVAPLLVAYGVPTVAGDATVGQTLAVTTPAFATPPDEVTTQWYADNVAVDGATELTLTLPNAVKGKKITVKQTATLTKNSQTQTWTGTSAATTAVAPGPISVVKVPTVSGNLWPTQKLTATAAEFSDTPDSVTIQWYIDGQAVTSFGNNLTFTVPMDASGKTLTVKQTATKDGHEAVAESEPTGEVAPYLVALGIPTVTGEAQVGQVLTVKTPGFYSPPDAVTTQWYADGVAVDGATGLTFTLPNAVKNKRITVKQTATLTRNDQTQTWTGTSAATTAVAPGPISVVKVPTVSGNLWPTQTVTAAPAEFSEVPDSVTTQWYIDGQAVTSFGDKLTFTVPMAASGKTLTVKQTATKDGHEAVAESEPTGEVAPYLVGLANPSVTGEAQVGQVLTVKTPGFYSPPDEVTTQWYADGVEIDGATELTLTVPHAVKGTKITAKQTATLTRNGQTQTWTGTSTATEAVAPADLAVVSPASIAGTAKVDQTLTGTPAEFLGDPDSVDNQWLADNEPIEGATGTTFKLTADQEGKTITFTSTATRGTEEPLVSESAPVGPVQAADIPLGVSKQPAIDGIAEQGKTLTGTPAEFSGTPAPSVVNQWLANGVAIEGATGTTFTLTADQVGKTITFKSEATRGADSLESISEPTEAVLAPLAVSKKAKISGTAQQGKTLTGTPAEFTGTPTGSSNQWLADGQEISGATGTTFTLTADQVGKKITFKSVATRGDETAESVSDATATVVAPDDEPGNGDDNGDGDNTGTPTEDRPTSDAAKDKIDVLQSGALKPGSDVAVEIGEQFAGDKVTVWLFSTPYNLGTYTVAANGRIEVSIPDGVELGNHRIAAYDTDGDLIGWQDVTIAAASTGGGTTVTPVSGSTGALPNTGADAPVFLVPLGVLMLLAGGTALIAARRREEEV